MPLHTSAALGATAGLLVACAAMPAGATPRPAVAPARTVAAAVAGPAASRAGNAPVAASAVTGPAGLRAAGAPAGARAAAPAGPPRADGGQTRVCVIGDRRITESSGLAASRRHPGIVYTFNDSGGTAQLYALGPDCRVRATLTLAGAHNRDWEAMAIGRDGLYVGDIGDNMGGAWPYVTVYRIREPARLRSRTIHATAYRIKYADGPRNAETLMIDPRTNRLYIASKEIGGSLYEGPKRLSTHGFNIMHRVGDAPFYATDGAFAPDGRTFVIRGYWDAEMYSAPGKELARVAVPDQKQGEGVTYAADGRSLLFSSEGTGQPLWREPVPAAGLPSESPKPSGSGAAPPRGGDGGIGARTLGLLLVGGLVLAGVVVFARRRAS